MRYTTTFLRIAGVAAALLHQGAALQSSSNLQVRDLSACEQAYGAGWMQCSGGKNAGCYNPEKGQVCLPTDVPRCHPSHNTLCRHAVPWMLDIVRPASTARQPPASAVLR